MKKENKIWEDQEEPRLVYVDEVSGNAVFSTRQRLKGTNVEREYIVVKEAFFTVTEDGKLTVPIVGGRHFFVSTGNGSI